MNTHQIVEAVLFASDAPLTADEIARADEMLDEDQVEAALQFLRAEYDDAERAFELVEVAEGFQILTRPAFSTYLERFDNVPRPSRLSGPALETLAIIAYRQPIGRLEVEYIRGVGASGVIRTLQERALIDVVGRADAIGRPLLYGTTSFFLEHFGFKSLEDLPRPDELPVVLRERIPLGPEDDGEEGDPDQLELDPEAPSEEGDSAEDGDAPHASADEAGSDDSEQDDSDRDDSGPDEPELDDSEPDDPEGDESEPDDSEWDESEPDESVTEDRDGPA